MGAYGSPELHPKLTQQDPVPLRGRRKDKNHKNKITCPYCGKEFGHPQKITPLKIILYSISALVAVMVLCLIALVIASFAQAIMQMFSGGDSASYFFPQLRPALTMFCI
jgi:hypothetical protein